MEKKKTAWTIHWLLQTLVLLAVGLLDTIQLSDVWALLIAFGAATCLVKAKRKQWFRRRDVFYYLLIGASFLGVWGLFLPLLPRSVGISAVAVIAHYLIEQYTAEKRLTKKISRLLEEPTVVLFVALAWATFLQHGASALSNWFPVLQGFSGKDVWALSLIGILFLGCYVEGLVLVQNWRGARASAA